MCRLIDVDDIFTNGVFAVDAQNPMKCITELLNRISNAPTAYDVEKVVAELEDKSDYEPIDYDYCDMACSGEEHFIATDKAIDIVRKGGAE